MLETFACLYFKLSLGAMTVQLFLLATGALPAFGAELKLIEWKIDLDNLIRRDGQVKSLCNQHFSLMLMLQLIGS